MAAINSDIKARAVTTKQAKKKLSMVLKLQRNTTAGRKAQKFQLRENDHLNSMRQAKLPRTRPNEKLGKINCKNINMLISPSIDEDIKIYVIRKTASATFKSIYNLRPNQSNDK